VDSFNEYIDIILRYDDFITFKAECVIMCSFGILDHRDVANFFTKLIKVLIETIIEER
jgi:hypothetical protein